MSVSIRQKIKINIFCNIDLTGISQHKTTSRQGFVLGSNPLHDPISSGFTANITGLSGTCVQHLSQIIAF